MCALLRIVCCWIAFFAFEVYISKLSNRLVVGGGVVCVCCVCCVCCEVWESAQAARRSAQPSSLVAGVVRGSKGSQKKRETEGGRPSLKVGCFFVFLNITTGALGEEEAEEKAARNKTMLFWGTAAKEQAAPH